MSGSALLLDTNAVVALLRGDAALEVLVENASWVGVSVISVLEFLCFPDLEEQDRLLFNEFLARVEVVGLGYDDKALIDCGVRVRKTRQLKLPDAIIAASAISRSASLVTADRDIKGIDGLSVITLPLAAP